MNRSIIPQNNYADSKEKNKNHLNHWRNFSRRITKNPYVKDYHFKKTNGTCSWCHRKYNNFVIHHIDYDHSCLTDNTIKVHTPTEKRPNKTTKVPDCHSCHQNNPDAFNKCMGKITAAHRHCNYIISTKNKD